VDAGLDKRIEAMRRLGATLCVACGMKMTQGYRMQAVSFKTPDGEALFDGRFAALLGPSMPEYCGFQCIERDYVMYQREGLTPRGWSFYSRRS
jgi:hypothetical protein